MGIPEELLHQYQQLAQQQMQMPMAQSPYQGIGTGLLGTGGAIGNAMGWHNDSGTAVQPINRLKKFFRINEAVEYNEGQEMIEPLDILRLKVAEWLYN